MIGKSTYFYGGEEVPIPTVQELIAMVDTSAEVVARIQPNWDKVQVHNPISNKENK